MFSHRRRWADIKTTLGRCSVCAEIFSIEIKEKQDKNIKSGMIKSIPQISKQNNNIKS